MAFIDAWPQYVQSVGIEVELVEGFNTRSHGDLPDDINIVWHHDASPVGPTGQWLSSAWDSGEPSAQIWVDTNGKWWFIGHGQAWHAGVVASGMPDNSNSVGIETDHTTGEDWPPALLDSLRKGTAAILAATGKKAADHLWFHKQIASPPGRKQDPDGLEIDVERVNVDRIMGGLPVIAGTTPAVTGGAVGTSVSEDVFKKGVFNYLYKGEKYDFLSDLFKGDLAPVNDQQLITTVQAIVAASLRSFMSGPDGSFIAFFPDYFGLYTDTKTLFTLEDIELVDFKIDVNDDELATDVFVTGESSTENASQPITQIQWLASNGVVNIRQNGAMSMLLGDEFADKANFDPDAFYARFGLRPLKATFVSVHEHLMEYLQALTLFQRKWAAQYRTQVQFTFMPELFPGMRILIKSHNVTVFVEEVVHTGSFETGFSTTATISSPASINGGGIKGMVAGEI